MKTPWTALVILLACASAWGAPFKDRHVNFRQPDGTRVEIVGSGDEFHAVFETLQGYTVVFDQALQAYCFARAEADGDLVSTGTQIHRAQPALLGLAPHQRMSPEMVKRKAAERHQAWEQAMETQSRWEAQKAAFHKAEASAPKTASGGGIQHPPMVPGPTVGNKIGLCLLVDFDDDPAVVPRTNIVNFCNADSYTMYGNNGSVKKFYKDNSNGLLIYSNVVTIYIRIPNSLHPKSYYNDTTKSCGLQGSLLLRDALNVMKALPNYTTEILPTFNNLTVDANNRVVACNVYYAGENGGVWNYGLWPNSSSLYSVGEQELSPGGKKLYRYQISNIGSVPELGTFCHENGHLLCGYPDIYDYDYDSEGGAGQFCLMNSGSSLSSGHNPSQICAYLKRASGWATTIEMDPNVALTGTLRAVAGSNFNTFYRYAKPGVPTEYFLVECRFKIGHDANLPASGIAIWHIDELGNRDNQSLLPNTTHANYEVTLVQADNRWDFEKNTNAGDANDLYYRGNPSATYSNVFSDASSPAAQWWDGSNSGLILGGFGWASALMTFTVGAPPAIVSHPQDVTVLPGEPVTFSVSATGTPTLTYQWRLEGTNLPGATNTVFSLTSVGSADAGTYSVLVRNGAGQATSSNALLTVIQFQFVTNNDLLTVTGYLGGGGEVAVPAVFSGMPVVGIADYAFNLASNLTGITIPASVTNIGASAFFDCPILTNIVVDAANPAYSSLDGVLFDKSQSTLCRFPNGRTGLYVVPSGVVALGTKSFANCSGLTNLVFPSTLTSIGEWALGACANLTSLVVPGSVTNLADGAFAGCPLLTALFFTGNPPLATPFSFIGSPVTVYYLPGATGWEATLQGQPAVLWNPVAQNVSSAHGADSNTFGFTLSGAEGIPLVIETSTNATGGPWLFLQSLILTNGTFDFEDPDWTNYPSRLYRFRSP